MPGLLASCGPCTVAPAGMLIHSIVSAYHLGLVAGIDVVLVLYLVGRWHLSYQKPRQLQNHDLSNLIPLHPFPLELQIKPSSKSGPKQDQFVWAVPGHDSSLKSFDASKG